MTARATSFRRALLLRLAVTVVVSLGSTAAAQNFVASDFHTASSPTLIKTADVNRDGHLDLILISTPPGSNSSDLVVHLGNGDGTFRAPLTFHSGIVFPANQSQTGSVQEFEVVDVNKDGNPDLAYVGGGQLGIMLGNGDGTFQQPRLFQGAVTPLPPDIQPAEDALNSLATADFNKDGNVDFVASSNLNIEIFYGNGDGTVRPVQAFAVGRPLDDPNGEARAGNAESGDFDGDGNADITFTIDGDGDFASSIHAWFGDGTGAFLDRRVVEDQTPPFTGVKVNDLNKDGHADISGIFHNCVFEGPCATGPFTYISNANRTFTRSIGGDNESHGGPTFADFNGDGLSDIVTTGCRFVMFEDGNCGEDVLQIYPLNPDGSPAAPELIDIAPSADQRRSGDVTAGDFNGDRRPDLAVLLAGTDQVMVFLNVNGTTDNSSCSTGSAHTVHVCSPPDGAPTTSPVRILSTSGSDTQIVSTAVYLDGVNTHRTGTNEVHTALEMSAGIHRLTIKSWDDAGNVTATTTMNVVVAGGGGGGSCAAPSSAGVNICTPANGETVTSPVHFTAAAHGTSGTVETMKIYVDGTAKFTGSGPSLDTSLAMASGKHHITIKGWDSTGAAVSKSIDITVGTGGGGVCSAPSSAPNNSVTICTPANGATPTSPVEISAAAKSTQKITVMQIYVDGVKKFGQDGSASVDISLPMSAGKHHITVKAWIGSTSFSKSVDITVH